mmetsp:Transcript_23531/g.42704  ORF Transcript_23531/g.42704 Transcript_23531/m.42704 type:complete len:107 (+) Transcript_23531:255-575(+)
MPRTSCMSAGSKAGNGPICRRLSIALVNLDHVIFRDSLLISFEPLVFYLRMLMWLAERYGWIPMRLLQFRGVHLACRRKDLGPIGLGVCPLPLSSFRNGIVCDSLS